MGSANRKATGDEITQCRRWSTRRCARAPLVSQLVDLHPRTYAETLEVVEVARAAAKHDGVYASHMRDEGAQVLEAITEAAQVGARRACG